MAKPRDYKAEYQRRIERNLAKGYSRSQARGHARTRELRVSDKNLLATNREKLEQRIQRMEESENDAGKFRALKALNRRELLAKVMGIEDAEKRADALELYNKARREKFKHRRKKEQPKSSLDMLEELIAEVEDTDFPERFSPLA